MITSSTHKNMLISPARSINAKVELYNGSTLVNTFKHTDALNSFTINRAGDKKFFGFGVCQEIELHLIDRDRSINIEKGQSLKVSFTANTSTMTTTPLFYVTEVSRNETNNNLTVKGSDIIAGMALRTISELNLTAPYTILNIISKVVSLLGIKFSLEVISRDAFNIEYTDGANFEGTESIRQLLDDIAEATQTIYFIDERNSLIFKHLRKDTDPVLTINKSDYFTLESKENRILSDICHTTELGDSVRVSTGAAGEVQYVRDNGFWELRTDISTLLNKAISQVGGLTINQFKCKWRGNYLLEPGDKIAIISKDDNTIITYLLDDTYTYNGGLSAETGWEYFENETETEDNPSKIGEAINKTYAKVDKVNKQIDLVVSETDELKSTVSNIKLSTDKVAVRVEEVQHNTEAAIGSMNTAVDELTKRAQLAVTPEQVEIAIESAIATNGANSVQTSTGFTFNSQGLTISKKNSPLSTQITENGMTILRNNQEALTVNNEGVKAEDLHATTFLIIGLNSRLEDYENGSRTGCFWINNMGGVVK